ncbi:SDR family oxidoreductase [Gordonia jinhuaensis]|uniref:Short-chain dehydrogenase n=1 Tax=Gordonia jinhuaensis TaxID=1517702 RepID=A0A916T1U6_9ACTN|nr:SDR family oxidoreductase [Gordonia jinhuaensis]GGB28359.1 short-chain dehydrogenase [Gordonia jinhuaensis]
MSDLRNAVLRRVNAVVTSAALQAPVTLVEGVRRRLPLIGNGGHDIAGRVIVVTGASSGIGRAAALRLGGLGAHVVLVARRVEELDEVAAAITDAGGAATVAPCDLSDLDTVDGLAKSILESVGHVDVLVNNAGRSIRRPVLQTVDRFHDYERTMTLNYYSPVRLTLGLLDSMVAAGGGHIINVGTWGVAMGAVPDFAAYVASKSALIAFGRSVDTELHDRGIRVTSIGFPLVRTPMIAPTADYDHAPALTVNDAADWIETAVRRRPIEMYPNVALGSRLIDSIAPQINSLLMRRGAL